MYTVLHGSESNMAIISQGSVATHLRCGRIVSGNFITNLLLSLPCMNLENQSTFSDAMDNSIASRF